jgi:hypothetical protein
VFFVSCIQLAYLVRRGAALGSSQGIPPSHPSPSSSFRRLDFKVPSNAVPGPRRVAENTDPSRSPPELIPRGPLARPAGRGVQLLFRGTEPITVHCLVAGRSCDVACQSDHCEHRPNSWGLAGPFESIRAKPLYHWRTTSCPACHPCRPCLASRPCHPYHPCRPCHDRDGRGQPALPWMESQ